MTKATINRHQTKGNEIKSKTEQHSATPPHTPPPPTTSRTDPVLLLEDLAADFLDAARHAEVGDLADLGVVDQYVTCRQVTVDDLAIRPSCGGCGVERQVG